MLFSLEVLQAGKGDCLILHYGAPDAPKFIVIDGGPRGIFRGSLEPRLNQIRTRWSPGASLPVEMLMVSHIDDDHIRGVLDLFEKLVDLESEHRPLPYAIRTLWHNSFDDILGNRTEELVSKLASTAQAMAEGAAAPAGLSFSHHSAAVVASVAQGRQLRQMARRLSIRPNARFEGLVAAQPVGATTIDWGENLTLTVIGPNQQRVEKLHDDWEKMVRRHGWHEEEAQAMAAAYVDNSVYNLASIMVLAEADGKRILLTGDGRGDDILQGLAAAGLLEGGAIHVDVLKMPHHGSHRNVEEDFFRRVTADRYTFSGDGTHGNPEIDTLRMLTSARGNADYQMLFTNRTGSQNLGPKLTAFFEEEEAHGRTHDVLFRQDSQLSVTVDLLDPVDY